MIALPSAQQAVVDENLSVRVGKWSCLTFTNLGYELEQRRNELVVWTIISVTVKLSVKISQVHFGVNYSYFHEVPELPVLLLR